MSIQEPGPTPADHGPHLDSATTPHRERSAASVWLLAIAAGLLAALVAWGVGERTHKMFQPSEQAAAQSYRFKELNEETGRANGRNGAIVYGTLGALLGLGLGVAGWLSRQSGSGNLVLGALTGLILGGLAGALPPFGIMPWQWMHRHDDPTSQTLVPVLIHLGLWVGPGAAAGLAYAIGRFGTRPEALGRGLLGGLIGALVGTITHELVVALAFATERTDEPFSTTALTRMIPHLTISLLTAVGVVLAFRPHDHATAKPVRPEGASALE